MKIFKYKNYDEYVKCQRAANEKKKNKVWAEKKNIAEISNYIIRYNPKTGLCHGTRGGYEQAWFREFLPGCKVYGTEIGDATAAHTIQWDFNVENPEWIGKFDFIYSNSFDHSFDISKTFAVWARQLKPGGIMILEMNRSHEHTGEISKAINKTDPTGIKYKELIKYIPVWIPGAKVIEILDMPVVTKQWRRAIIIQVV